MYRGRPAAWMEGHSDRSRPSRALSGGMVVGILFVVVLPDRMMSCWPWRVGRPGRRVFDGREVDVVFLADFEHS